MGNHSKRNSDKLHVKYIFLLRFRKILLLEKKGGGF